MFTDTLRSSMNRRLTYAPLRKLEYQQEVREKHSEAIIQEGHKLLSRVQTSRHLPNHNHARKNLMLA